MTGVSLRFPDRRLGFARRQHGRGRARNFYRRMLASYRDRPQALALVLVAVLTLNIADLLLTLRAIELGAGELNPIMAALISADPLLAGAFKVTLVTSVAVVLWVMRRYRQMLEASLLLLGGFVIVTSYSAFMLLIAA